MKLPNGYGAVVKLSGKRRKPYAARVTLKWTEDGKQIRKYLGFFRTRQEALKALANYFPRFASDIFKELLMTVR